MYKAFFWPEGIEVYFYTEKKFDTFEEAKQWCRQQHNDGCPRAAWEIRGPL